MSIQATLKKLKRQKGIPAAYGRFKTAQKPPYLVYLGNGQTNVEGDDTYVHSVQDYQIEYYYREKDEEMEKAVEQILLEDGYLYEKSPDAYIEEEDLWVIYYTV
ncbi:MAG: hypothetical protein IJ061_06555 [Lachnospiraceae bacterium]|nr:hypothetical protein [Lachnospiraceae bacterium]